MQTGSPSNAPITCPEPLPAVPSDPADQVRRVQQGGWVGLRGRARRIPRAFVGQRAAPRPTGREGQYTAASR